jgi:hypothetical protein
MSFDRESQGHTAFERQLLESARKDAPPSDVQDAWTRFAGVLSPFVSIPHSLGGSQTPTVAAATVATKAVGMRSAWVSTVKWILLGAIGGSSLTAAWTMQRRGEKVDSLVPVLDRAPAPLSEPNAAALSPPPSVVDQPASASRGRHRPSLRRHSPSPGETAESHAGEETADKAVLDASTLAAEVARIDAARAASATGDNAEAIRLIDRYHRDFPNGALAPDADVVALESMAAKGDRAEIARRAALFLSRYPADPHAARVKWLAEHLP